MSQVHNKLETEGSPPVRPATPALRPWVAPVLITLLGAILRFYRLGYQSFWVDEGYTIARIRGTFPSLLDQLAKQGFPPGWYAMLRAWCLMIERVTHNGAFAFSPAATRSLPALLGTLTIPAMYWLARQFASRPTALLVALLAAVNPFLIYYSRDIKMYAPLWFFCTLHMAFFFHWLNARKLWPAMPLWLLAGICMTATQSVAWLLVPLELIFLLSYRRIRWINLPIWFAGVAAIAAFPAFWFFHYVQPNRWLPRLISGPEAAGSEWYRDYTSMNWQTLAGVPTSHLLGYLWPVYPPDAKIINWFDLGKDFDTHLDTRSLHWLATAQVSAAILIFAILLVGLLPWRGRKRPGPELPPATQGRWWWLALWIVLPTAILAATWIPPESPWFHRIWQGWDVKPFWEPRYLGIIMPAWLLWLAVTLRRLPTAPLRIVLVSVVVAASLFSASSNFLVYRNAPYQHAGEIAERYVDLKDRRSEAVAMPDGYWPYPAMNASLTAARHVRPGSPEDFQFAAHAEDNVPASAPKLWSVIPSTPAYVPQWVRSVAARPAIKTIVLTDPFGDVTAPENPLSTDSLTKLLGPRWKLVDEESYPLYFEWRFYIFNTWRTRVWQRLPP